MFPAWSLPRIARFRAGIRGVVEGGFSLRRVGRTESVAVQKHVLWTGMPGCHCTAWVYCSPLEMARVIPNCNRGVATELGPGPA